VSIRLLVAFAGCLALAWSTLRWRQAVQAVMVVLVFEGAMRKWLFPGAQDMIYFGKDVILLGAYAGFLRDRANLSHRRVATPTLAVALALAVAYGLLEIFNPRLPNLLVGLMGFKAYFLYAPLVWVVPAVFPSDVALARFLRRYLALAIPVGLLAIAQFFSPSSSFLNTYARPDLENSAYVATFGSSAFVRVTGTFSYISGYSAYLLCTAILLLSVLAATRWRFKRNLTVYSSLGATLLGLLMTGSRGPVLILVVLLPLYWWLALVREGQSGTLFFRMLLGVGLLTLLVNSIGAQAIGAFQGRVAGSGSEVLSRTVQPFTTPWYILPQAGLLGYGIGATHQTAASLARGMRPFSWLNGTAVEVESGRVMLELGAFGFLLTYFLRVYLAVFALIQAKRLRAPFHRILCIGSLMLFLAQLPGSIVFDVTAGLYYWFSAGLLMLAVRLDLEAVSVTDRTTSARMPRRPSRRPSPLASPTAPTIAT
jgi:hypothetical protein